MSDVFVLMLFRVWWVLWLQPTMTMAEWQQACQFNRGVTPPDFQAASLWLIKQAMVVESGERFVSEHPTYKAVRP